MTRPVQDEKIAPPKPTFTRLTFDHGIESWPSLSPDGTELVYAGESTGNYDVYIRPIGSDGQATVNLTKDSPASDSMPAFSPDGRWIAFSSLRENTSGIFVMGRRGESMRRLTNAGADPVWTPDGREIIYSGESGQDGDVRRVPSELWAVNVESGERRRICEADAVPPRVSPDGRFVAFWALPVDPGRKQFSGADRDVWVAPLAGGARIRITTGESAEWNPAWSPDGRFLYFSSDRSGSMNIWRVPMDAATGRAVGEPVAMTAPTVSAGVMSVASDGTVAYTAHDFNTNIRSIAFDPAGGVVQGNLSDVITGQRAWLHPDVSPDGRLIALRSWRGQEAVWVVGVDGSGLRPLTNDAARDRGSRWAPDGSLLSYSSHGGEYQFWTIKADGSGARQLTHGDTTLNYPLPSPDGRWVGGSNPNTNEHFIFDARDWTRAPERLPSPPVRSTTYLWDWSPDGTRIAASDTAGGLWVFTLANKTWDRVGTQRVGHLVDAFRPETRPVNAHARIPHAARCESRRLGALMTVVVLLLLLVVPSFAAGQTVTGTMQGVVRDPSGGVLPGVSVGARSLETGQTRDTVTNDVGYYVLPFLPIGGYDVTAGLSGFKTIVRRQVTITLNDTRVVDFSLEPASVAETVTVRAEAVTINTTNGEIKGSLNEQEIADRPISNRGSFLSLAETFTGFAENPTSGQNNPTASSGSSINFNGTGTRGATFQINGVNNDDASENQHRQGAATSTIKEFQVITNSYSAEFGRGYGAVVLVQTKAGTNQWHGDLYEFRQDSSWNARSAFSLTKPDNARDQFGFTVGFPVRRNSVFAFGSMDHKRFEGFQTYARDLFLPSELAAPRLTRGNDTPANRAFIDGVLTRFPSVTPNDPRSSRTYQTVQLLNQPADDHSARLDWTPSGRHTFTGRYQHTRQIFESDDVIVGEQARQNNRQGNIGMTWTHVLGPATVGELRYGLGLRKTRVDIAAGNETPIVRFANSPVSGSIIGNAGNFPINRDQTDNQFVYNLAKLFGRTHQFKTGVDLRFQRLDDLADNFSRGFWNFNASCGGTVYSSSYAAFLDGCVNSYQDAWGPFFLENRMNEYNLYAEDSWRVRSNLTVNLGIRYEFVQAPSEAEGRLDYGFSNDANNVQPRIGAAWSPEWKDGLLGAIAGGGSGTFSMRGGFGLYDGRLFQSVFSQTGASLRTNPPTALSRTFTTLPDILNLSDPTGGFVFVPGPQTARHVITYADGELEMPRTRQWNVTVERRIPFNSTLRVSYTGTRGIGLLRYTQANVPASPLAGPVRVVDHPNNAPAAGFPDLRGRVIDRIAADVLCAGTGLPAIAVNAQCPQPVPIADNEISFRVPRTNERRPDPRYTTNLAISNDSQSWYDGLQVEWTRRYAAGLWFQASYTWSVSEDTTSEATFVGAGDSNQLGPDKRFARGYSRFHTPHRFTFNGSYRLPFWRGRPDLAGTLAGGWTLSGVVRLAHGTPFTVTDAIRDLNFDGFSENRPILLDNSILGATVDDPATSESILRNKFRPAQFGEGDLVVGRNTFFGDGQATVDIGLFKSFRFPWQHDLTVRLEAYNAFNNVQYGFPTSDITNVNFGRLLGGAVTYSPRTIQIGLQYRF